MDWNKLRIFHAAAEAGSFTHAGDVLDMSQSAVSRQVSALEKELKIPLFHRHARGLLLTEQGEMLYRAANEIFGKLEQISTRLADSKSKPFGDLKVTTSFGLGSHWLTPKLGEFIDLYPDINVHLLLHNYELDIAMREADVAIWLREPTQNDLIRRKLFTVHLHVYGSNSYVKKYGAPQNIDDLHKHRLITFGGSAPDPFKELNWLENIIGKMMQDHKPILRINSIYGLRRAVKSGLGLAVLPDYIVEEDQDIIPVLKNEEMPKLDTYFVYTEEQKDSKKIAVFKDFLVSKAKKWAF